MKFTAKTLLFGGLAVAAAAGALKNRQRVAGLLGARSSVPEAPPAPTGPRATPAPTPKPSNYDAAGPPENTATKLPAPEPVIEPGGTVDEAAEEAAAAAEAAAIGGPAPTYTDLERGHADEALRGVLEGGGGESEGQEQAESALIDNAESSAGDPIEGGRQIDDVIEAQDDPFSGEKAEALKVDAAPAGLDDPTESPTATSDPEEAAPAGAAFDDPVALSIDDDVEIAPAAEHEDTPAPAEPAAAQSDDEPAPAEPVVEDVPEEAFDDSPATSEQPEPEPADEPTDERPGDQPAPPADPTETPAAEKSAAVWGAPTPEEQKAEAEKDAKAEPLWRPPGAPAGKDDADDGGGGGSEWQTWSGKAVDS